MTPESMKKYLTDMDCMSDYDLARPTELPPVIVTKDYAEIAQILQNEGVFDTPYASQAGKVIRGKGFFTATSDAKEYDSIIAALNDPQFVKITGDYFLSTTKRLIESQSYALVGGKTRCVDLVRDVFNVVPILWAASDVAGLHVKTKKSDDGDILASDLYTSLSDIYSFVFLEVESAKVVVLEKKCREHIRKLSGLIQDRLDVTILQKLSLNGITSAIYNILSYNGKGKDNHQHALVKRLYEIGSSTDQLTNTILALMVSAVEMSLALTNVMNLYLDTEHEAPLQSLLQSTEPKADIDAYILEAFRLDPPFRGVYRVAGKEQQIGSLSVTGQARLFLDIASANLNDATFPNPQAVDLTRSKERYLSHVGLYRALGVNLTVKIIGQSLRAVFGQTNLRRSPGPSGKLKRFRDHSQPQLGFSYLDHNQLPCAWPNSFVIQYDSP